MSRGNYLPMVPFESTFMAETNAPGCFSKRKVSSQLQKNKPIYCTILGVFCFALQNVFLRFFEDSLPLTEIICLIYSLALLIVFPTMLVKKKAPKADTKEKLALLCVRGLVHTGATTLFYIALLHMRVGDVTAIALTSPVFVGIFGRIFLKETFDLVDALLVVVNLGGVILIAQPSFIFKEEDSIDEEIPIFAPLCAVASSVMYATSFLTIRRLGILGVDSFVIVLYYLLIASVVTGVFTVFTDAGWTIPPCGTERYSLVAAGLFVYCGEGLVTLGYAKEKSFLVSILNTNEVIFAYLLEFALFGVVPDLVALLGASLIMLASIMVSLKNTNWFKNLLGYSCRRYSADEQEFSCADQPNQHGNFTAVLPSLDT